MIENVDDMDVDGQQDANIDVVVLARQKKLDKGKSVMKGKKKPTPKKISNVPRVTGITIRENTNPQLSSNSDSKAEENNEH